MNNQQSHSSRKGMFFRVLVLTATIFTIVVLPTSADSRLGLVEAARPAQAANKCQNIQLLIRAQSSRGAAGTIGIIYRLHNMWGRACTLSGYPGVQLLNRTFGSLPTTVHRGGNDVGNVPARTVHVAAYGNAYFALFYSDVPVAGQPPCASAHYVMIIPPNDFLPVVTYAFTHGGSITECTGNVHVSPVTAQPRY